MSKNKSTYYRYIANAGNFTKNAVENFEENIVNKTNYLENVKNNKKQDF